MQSKLLAGTAVCALLALGSAAQANTLVATIIGAYDEQCSPSDCIAAVNNPNITNYANDINGGGTPRFDTPSLFILNPTSNPFTNVQITLTGYQDAAGGGVNSSYSNSAPTPATLTIGLPNIAANTVYQLAWDTSVGLTFSNGSGQNLFAYDYDDLFGTNTLASGTPGSTGIPDPSGHMCGTNDTSNHSLCSFVGNFDVAFSADLNGNPISSVFSPDNTQGGGNVTGSFVGWEGLDGSGLSETLYDIHSKTFPGTLANIFTGTNQAGGGTPVPEPGTLALIAGGLGALATVRRRRKTKQA
jgi:hypothetical protein